MRERPLPFRAPMVRATGTPNGEPARSRAIRFEPREGGQGIDDDDFGFDATLKICGDFRSDADRESYAQFICDKLNAAPAIPAPEGAQAVMRQALEALEAYSRWAASMDTEMQAHNAITALRAALAAPAPLATPDWQQIETAPRDGTAILAFWKPVTGAPASHCYGITEFVEGRWRNPEEDDDYYIDPTHWMPLPAAPQTKEPKA